MGRGEAKEPDGLPIGAILVWQTGRGDDARFQLIDGLQRTTTVVKFLENRLAYADVGKLADALVNDTLAAVRNAVGKPDIEQSQVNAEIKSWLANASTGSEGGFESFPLAKRLVSAFDPEPSLEQVEAVQPLCAKVVDAINAQLAVSDYQIPVILFDGDETRLPEIFELINTQGIQLSKYQKYAASWSHRTTEVTDAEIIAAIEAKYGQLEKYGYVVARDEEQPESPYDLFEYLFGLGRKFGDRYPSVFAAKENPSEVESLSFSVAATSHQLHLTSPDMALLPSEFETSDDIICPEGFQSAVEWAMGTVDTSLRPLYSLKLNTKSGSETRIAVPELQLVSFVAALTANRFGPPSFKERESWASVDETQHLKALRQHLCYDMIREEWGSHGDAKLFAATWREVGSGYEPNPRYLQPVPWELLEGAQESWFEDSLATGSQRDRASIRQVEKMLLRFVYMNKITVLHNYEKQFEIDHILPIARLRPFIPTDQGWPLSCVGNLALLEQFDNRMKSTQTLKEYVDDLASKGLHAQVDSIKSLALSPVEECVLPAEGSSEPYSLEQFLDFLRRRWEVLKEELKASLY